MSRQASRILEAAWEELCETQSSASETPSAVRIVSIDCAVDAQPCDDLDVASYPAIRLYQDGRMSRYRGPRRASE